MTWQETTITFILASWLLLNICYVIFNKRMAAITNKLDVFRWLSNFQLFSDTVNEYRLFYRDVFADESVTGWRYVSLTPKWKIHHAVWFPGNLVLNNIKILIDHLAEVIQLNQKEISVEKVSRRFVHRAITDYLKRFPAEQKSVARQFKIEDIKNREIFTSSFYDA